MLKKHRQTAEPGNAFGAFESKGLLIDEDE
jgi:hypothetical protein